MKRAGIAGAIVFFALSCRTTNERRHLEAAVLAAVNHFDPNAQAQLIAHDAELPVFQELVGEERRVMSAAKYAREHPDGPVPFNIQLQSARLTEEGVVVRMHVQAISHPPPGVPACGTGYELLVTTERGEWKITELSATVC